MDERKLDTLHAGVKDFLEYFGYEDSLTAYQNELEKHEAKYKLELPSSSDDAGISDNNAKESLMQSFLMGNQQQFWLLWDEHIPNNLRDRNDGERLEFKLHLYFAVYPYNEYPSIFSEGNVQNTTAESSMQEFKTYLETKGAGLSQNTELVAYYALPFVPNPRDHPTFKILFEDVWKEELTEELSMFLQNVLNQDSTPYLYKLLSSINQNDVSDQSDEIASLKNMLEKHEIRNENLSKKLSKLTGDYHNLIGISAELVDSLEKCVRGHTVAPEYLQEICGKLFGSTIDRPGSAAYMLRASIQNDIILDTEPLDMNVQLLLDFDKVRKDLIGKIPVRKKSLLLQALIWRLTKTESPEQRSSIVVSFIANDILGCRSDPSLVVVTKIIATGDETLMEYLARFINVIASFAGGRQYISQSEHMLEKLVGVMTSQNKHTVLYENILGSLQKLSLKRNVQSILIESSVIEWLTQTLEEPDDLSEYALEYTVALLMNLCLRMAGKKRCSDQPEQLLTLLAHLLRFDNQDLRQYINGILYSVLELPSFKTAAVVMGLEEILKYYVYDSPQDERQLQFILKQLNTQTEGQTDHDIQSDGEDDDDDDDEGEEDAIETECEKEESICATIDEESGEELLRSRYTESSTKSQENKVKKFKQNGGPLAVPTTPRRGTAKHSTVGNEAHIGSSRGGRKQFLSSSNRQKTTKSFKQAFTSRPKVTRDFR